MRFNRNLLKYLEYFIPTYSISSFSLDTILTTIRASTIENFVEPHPLVNSFVQEYGVPNGLLLYGLLEYGAIIGTSLVYSYAFTKLLKRLSLEKELSYIRKFCLYFLLTVSGTLHLLGAYSWLRT